MSRIIFATNNQHKVDEIKSILPPSIDVITLKEAGIDIDIPEPFGTLEENAREKSEIIYKLTKTNCFAEDTGLEVKVLNNEPGVKSARYAGEERNFDMNVTKLLDKLKNNTDRVARFRTVICVTLNGKHNIFDGECKGDIITERRGNGGFGYDCIFVPEGASKTFAEMSLPEKNIYSHRKKATQKLISYLKTL